MNNIDIKNCRSFAPDDWIGYFLFISGQSSANAFAHTIPASTPDDLAAKVINRLQKRKDSFVIYTLWIEKECVGSIEISIPPSKNEELSHAYFLFKAHTNHLFTQQNNIAPLLKKICNEQQLQKLRITCSDKNAQEILLKSGAKCLIHDIIQYLTPENIDLLKITALIDSGRKILAENRLTLSFHHFFSEAELDAYITFYNSIIGDIIVFDSENGELPLSKEIVLERYNYLKAYGGMPMYFILTNDAGLIVALTEVWHSHQNTNTIDGGLTAVAKPYRKQGIALFLKSLMVKKVLELLPELELINTANSSINYPILGVNSKLNFEQLSEEFILEITG